MRLNLSDVPDPKEGIFGYFPKESFRPKQKMIIEAVHNAFTNQNFRYVILEAPTGIGKSAIALTLARFYKSAHILTAQKILQDQYKEDFPNDITVMKGRGEYKCVFGGDEPRTCATGPCTLKKEVLCRPQCNYKKAFQEALSSKTVALSYDGYYYHNAYGQGWPPRDLMVIDECQNLEKKFLGFNELNINDKKSLVPLPEYKRIREYDDFLVDLKKESKERLDILHEIAITDAELREVKDLSALVNKITLYFETRDELEYVFTYTDKKSHRTLTFQPIFVSEYIRRDIFGLSKNQVNPTSQTKFLMMSATILDRSLFCEAIGLDPNQVKFIRVGSPFPKENRPIYIAPAGSMSYKNKASTMPRMLRNVQNILDNYPDVRGIIHTVSEANAEAIRSNMWSSRLTFRRDYRTVVEALEAHQKKPNSILVASGLAEGIDLKDDMSRLQILMKVPYLSLGDNRIKRRANLSWTWYGYQAALVLIQSLGRSVRSPEDRADTYLLDSDFDTFLRKQGKLIPKYIRESIQRL